MYDIIIVGAGPCGLTAAVYAARTMKKVLVLEKEGFGGQIVYSPGVENYPGVQGTIGGADLASNLVDKAMQFGAEVEFDDVLSVKKENGVFTVTGSSAEYTAKAVILATGVHHRKLGLESEERLIGKGVSFCAICDGAFFKGKDVAVIGGGSTALADALLLSDLASKVYLIHRRDAFRGEAHTVEKLRAKANVEFVLNSVPEEFLGTASLEGVRVKDKEGNERTIPCSGVFVAIGQVPSNSPFAELAELDESGYLIANESCTTKTEGLFAAGDCRTKVVRQLTTATADGTVAALAACDYIDSLE